MRQALLVVDLQRVSAVGSAESESCCRSTSCSKWVDLILVDYDCHDQVLTVWCLSPGFLVVYFVQHDLYQVTNNLFICIQNSRHYLSMWLIMQQVICLLLSLIFVKCYVRVGFQRIIESSYTPTSWFHLVKFNSIQYVSRTRKPES